MKSYGKILAAAIAVAIFALLLVRISMFPGDGQAKEDLSTGERFHLDTSLTLRGVLGDVLGRKPPKPPNYKTYKGAKLIKLPEPKHTGVAVEKAIKKRRSIRNYSSKPVSLSHIGELLFAAQGKTGESFGDAFRSAPSAGALYPFEIYPVINNASDLVRGVYHYDVRNHALELVREGDFRDEITSAGLKQGMLGEAGVTFVLSAIFNRVRSKYGERGMRYVYIEAGHISQNIFLEAVSLGLGSACVGAFFDDKVNKLIGVDGREEAAIYLHAVGSL